MFEWKNPKDAFDQAIQEGRLSADPQAPNFAGHYMYMGPTIDGQHDAFKHIDTRMYLPYKEAKPSPWCSYHGQFVDNADQAAEHRNCTLTFDEDECTVAGCHNEVFVDDYGVTVCKEHLTPEIEAYLRRQERIEAGR